VRAERQNQVEKRSMKGEILSRDVIVLCIFREASGVDRFTISRLPLAVEGAPEVETKPPSYEDSESSRVRDSTGGGTPLWDWVRVNEELG
jgi:hypothetical protein